MALNYTNRLEKLKARRFDEGLKESFLSKGFRSNEIPENIKYTVESMLPIDSKYNVPTLQAAKNVCTHLENGLVLPFARTYRRQGSVEHGTNIKIHSDIDQLTIIDDYHFLDSGVTPTYPYTGDPNADIKQLRADSLKILRSQYISVDDSKEKCITIYNSNLRRYVDVVFAFWHNTSDYNATMNEYHRGIRIASRYANTDFPFSNKDEVIKKGIATNDGSRMAIRLLKTLIADSEPELKLVKGFHVTSLIHSIQDYLLSFYNGNYVDIARAASRQLGGVITDANFRLSIKSPNGLESPLANEALIPELTSLKRDLDDLISDAVSEIGRTYQMQNKILLYA